MAERVAAAEAMDLQRAQRGFWVGSNKGYCAGYCAGLHYT